MTIAIPGGRLHTDPRCPHLRHTIEPPNATLVDATWADGCRTCYRREMRRKAAERAARDRATVEAARAEIAALPPTEVARRVSLLSRGERW